MLVAEDLHFADWFKDRPLIYSILCKAIAFSVLFLVLYFAEEVFVGMVKGKTIGESLPTIGGGSPSDVLFVGIILSIALIPFFGFREIGRVIGERQFMRCSFSSGRLGRIHRTQKISWLWSKSQR